jgi:hypothetical protein
MARLVTVTGGLALVAVLLAGCGGGGDDRATVEAGLRHYLSTLVPEHSAFPSGAGVPRVKDNGCKDVHRQFNPRDLLPPGWTKFKKGERFGLWQCVVRFRRLTLPVAVAVDDSTGVVWAWPGSSKNPHFKWEPPRTYTG